MWVSLGSTSAHMRRKSWRSPFVSVASASPKAGSIYVTGVLGSLNETLEEKDRLASSNLYGHASCPSASLNLWLPAFGCCSIKVTIMAIFGN